MHVWTCRGHWSNCLWMESHAEASTTDEGEDESGEPRQHHVRPAAEEFHENIELFSFSKDMCPKLPEHTHHVEHFEDLKTTFITEEI